MTEKKPIVAVERGNRPTGRFKYLGGSDHDDLNEHLLVNTTMALPQAASAGEITASAMLSLKPEDAVEGLLAANDASLELYRRAWIPGQLTELMERYLNLAMRLRRAGSCPSLRDGTLSAGSTGTSRFGSPSVVHLVTSPVQQSFQALSLIPAVRDGLVNTTPRG